VSLGSEVQEVVLLSTVLFPTLMTHTPTHPGVVLSLGQSAWQCLTLKLVPKPEGVWWSTKASMVKW
jgi:hypothetical protein